MKLLKSSALYLILVTIVVSCSFSTAGTIANRKHQILLQDNIKSTKPVAIKPIDTSNYTIARKLTPKEIAKRDSILTRYIGNIVKPYIDDLKESNNKNIHSLIDIIRAQNSKMDSLDFQRQKDSKYFDLTSASRDSLTQALILKDKYTDSLKKVINQLNKVDKTTNEIIKTFSSISEAISVFSSIMLYLLIAYAIYQIVLSTLIYLRVRKSNNINNYHA